MVKDKAYDPRLPERFSCLGVGVVTVTAAPIKSIHHASPHRTGSRHDDGGGAGQVDHRADFKAQRRQGAHDMFRTLLLFVL